MDVNPVEPCSHRAPGPGGEGGHGIVDLVRLRLTNLPAGEGVGYGRGSEWIARLHARLAPGVGELGEDGRPVPVHAIGQPAQARDQ